MQGDSKDPQRTTTVPTINSGVYPPPPGYCNGLKGVRTSSTSPTVVSALPQSPFDGSKPTAKCFLAEHHDIHVIIDDSSLMRPLWMDVKQGVQDLLTSACSREDTDSIQVSFFNHRQVCTVKRVDQVARLFNSVVPQGSKPTGMALRRVTGAYWSEFDRFKPPLSIIVITNGGCDDIKAVEAVLVENARKIRRMGLPRGVPPAIVQIKISFLGVGTRLKLAVHGAVKRLVEEINDTYAPLDIAEYVIIEKSNEESLSERMVEFVFGEEPSSQLAEPETPPEVETPAGSAHSRSSIGEGELGNFV